MNSKQVQENRSRSTASATPAEFARRRAARLGWAAMLCVAAMVTGPARSAATAAGEGLPAGAGAAEAGAVTSQKTARQTAASPLDRRVALLTAELQLSPKQQLEVKALLQRQREEIRQVWADATLPPPIRVSRTQAISDRTADGIRALLDEAQRQKYIQPRRHETATGTAGADVEAWIGAGQRN